MRKLQFGGLDRGSYILILYLNGDKKIQIGRLGRLSFTRGFYAYVGSAFGPGGLISRLNHHLRPTSKPHWHIDYLRRKTSLVEVWISQQKDRQEHLWATRLSDLNHTASPIARFGCSDCKCATHLFYFPQQPSFETFATLIEPALPGAAKMKKIILK